MKQESLNSTQFKLNSPRLFSTLDRRFLNIYEDERRNIIDVTASMMKLSEIEISASQHRLELISI